MLTIAIDGPVGAGKSTIAQGVAKALSIPHLDTGAMYRGAGYIGLCQGVDLKNEQQVMTFIDTIYVDVLIDTQGQKVYVNGQDVTQSIRTPQVSMAASDISKWPSVRNKMVSLQQKIAASQSIVLDGRDIGTRVLPNANVKIFLTATPQERAKRRFNELEKKNTSITFQEVLDDLKARDLQDSTRETDPLRPAEDAIIVDTTSLSQIEVVEEILKIVEAKRSGNSK